jgi:exodeoxyribonuclease-1
MQFAGQRTDMDLKPIGDPVNVLLKLTPDVLPDPDAVLVTGITPQKVVEEGTTEAEFLKIFQKEIATPGTIFVGFNSVRFDDEFMRYLHYRNFYDAYEWQWKDGRSRWDLLDLTRLTRALRPDGIKWPNDSSGKSVNRLELLTAANKLEHGNAHDALSDVNASIALARLICSKQPKLFDYLLNLRDKNKVKALVSTGQPFVYASGKYPTEYEKTTVAVMLTENPDKQGVLVYDLRHDPSEFLKMSPQQIAERWQYTKEPDAPPRLPIKTLKFNRCPAVAPLGVLDDSSAARLKLDRKILEANRRKLQGAEDFPKKVLEALALMEKQRQSARTKTEQSVDARLYDGFFDNPDRAAMQKVQTVEPEKLDSESIKFHDKRLGELLPLYKARNFPRSLSDSEQKWWEDFCAQRLFAGGANSRLAKYFARIDELAGAKPTKERSYLLEELRLYGQSLMPAELDV